ncbi:MAG: DUF547 domain-containing protein [Spirochaetales bacterium]|nr:DUF547 domain-containing protein [Spirochaetales bacterium]
MNIFRKLIGFSFFVILLAAPLGALDHTHAAWNSLLKKNVSVSGQVQYSGFRGAAFEDYLKSLSAVSAAEYESFSRPQKMAFLINAYNAFTVKLILDHYPVSSIKKIGGPLKSPWKIEFFTLIGARRHLDYIEHGVLRPKFGDPRIHAAVVCASRGCPPLLNAAFTADKLNAQLDERMKNFLNTDYYNRCDGKKAELSSIFKWYAGDFGGEKQLKTWIARYNKACASVENISYKDYDWALNSR